MTEKNNQAAEIVEKDLVAAVSDTESVNDFESAEGRMLITEQEDAKGESAPTSTAADGRDEKTPIIFLDDVHVIFKTRTGSILHPNKVHAVNGLTLKLMPGETIGIVGESGCGKSTTANVMCGLQAPTSGHVYFKGTDVTKRTAAQRRIIGRVISVVFQDPATALNARMSVRDQLTDPMVVHNVSVRAQILNLLMDLKKQLGLAMVFISHDIQTVRYISDRIIVMNHGQAVERGTAEEVFNHPKDDYTRLLLGAAPSLLHPNLGKE